MLPNNIKQNDDLHYVDTAERYLYHRMTEYLPSSVSGCNQLN